jgi:tetratricopeptide (TPR) repeat protein
MRQRILLSILSISLLLFGCSSQYSYREPTKLSKESSPETKELINKGIQAHDANQFDQSIQYYQEALKIDSGNTEALYEMALSYSAKGEYQHSLDKALQGAEYDSPFINGFYLLIGTNLDDLGKSKDAIDVYTSTLKHFPKDYLLYYNLGLTYNRLQEYSAAKDAFKKALTIKPTHQTSHLALAQIFQAEGNTIPALLAYCRFLTLEQKSTRANYARNNIVRILNGGVSKDPGNGNITISFNSNQATSEGNFAMLNLFLSLKAASRTTEDNKQMSDDEFVVAALASLFGMMGESDSKELGSGFAVKYYIPYFVTLDSQNFTKSFCDLIFKKKDSSDESISSFLQWSNSYEWPVAAR